MPRLRGHAALLCGAVPAHGSLAIAVVLAGCAAAGTADVPSGKVADDVAVPEDLRAEVERAEAIGGSLYLQDKASAIATDVMFEHVPEHARGDVGGYLTIREGDPATGPTPFWRVLFFTGGDDPRILYRVRVPMSAGAEPSFEAVKPPATPSGGEQLLMRARRTAIAAVPEDKRVQPINPAILPGSAFEKDSRGLLVYLIAGTTKPGVAVFGRHYRVLVSEDGGRVERMEPLSKGVIEIPFGQGDPDHRPVALVVSHLVSDCPVETHVFTSLLFKMPVAVATARGDWAVSRGKISFVRPRKRE